MPCAAVKWLPVSCNLSCSFNIIMAALRSKCGHYIFALWFLSFFFFFSPRLISAAAGWMSTIFVYTWLGLSANLECRYEMCCTQLAWNSGSKNVAKNRHLRTIAQICGAESSQLRHASTIGKNFLASNTSSTCPADKYGVLKSSKVGTGLDCKICITKTTKDRSWSHWANIGELHSIRPECRANL